MLQAGGQDAGAVQWGPVGSPALRRIAPILVGLVAGCGTAVAPKPSPSPPPEVQVPAAGRPADAAAITRLRASFEAGGRRCIANLVEELSRALGDEAGHPQGSESLSAAAIACEDWDALTAHLRDRLAETPSAALYLRLARAEGKAQRWLESIDAADAAKALDPSADIAWVRGFARFHLGDHDGASVDLQSAAQGADDTAVQSRVLLAQGLLSSGSLEQALAGFTRALDLDPRNGSARQGRARALARLGRWTEAEQDLRLFQSTQREIAAAELRRIHMAEHSREFHRAREAGDRPRAEAALSALRTIATEAEQPHVDKLATLLTAPEATP